MAKAERTAPAADAPVPPIFFRYLRAYVELLDEGGVVNQTKIAERMSMSRMGLWKVHERRPDMAKWTSDQIERLSDELAGPVIRRMGMIGLKGSVDHAKLYLQTKGRIGADATPAAAAPTINVIVPQMQSLATWPGGVLEVKR